MIYLTICYKTLRFSEETTKKGGTSNKSYDLCDIMHEKTLYTYNEKYNPQMHTQQCHWAVTHYKARIYCVYM